LPYRLGYAPTLMVEGEGFEPSKAVPADLQSAPFGQLGYPSNFFGADDGTRTRNLLITSQLLFQLSYVGRYYGGADESRTRDLLRDRQAC
jgi:hypothetical protein